MVAVREVIMPYKAYLDDRYINAEMVADGAAWVYRKYDKNPKLLELGCQAQT